MAAVDLRGRGGDDAAMTGLGPNAALIGQPHSRQALDTPALLLDLDALERNIAAMAASCARHGRRPAPACQDA